MSSAMPMNPGKASQAEAEKLIEEIKRLIKTKGLNVELVEKERPDVTGQECDRCTVCPCIICP
jgi:hypothetical protein